MNTCYQSGFFPAVAADRVGASRCARDDAKLNSMQQLLNDLSRTTTGFDGYGGPRNAIYYCPVTVEQRLSGSISCNTNDEKDDLRHPNSAAGRQCADNLPLLMLAAVSSREAGKTPASSDQGTPHKILRLVPTCFDVLNGRGQGVQRHPGNVKYRTLVSLNKCLYAKCPRQDKAKISKGIVAAVREFGGRFLELDERTRMYNDIGDKKAWEKTSQALREGQTKIRQNSFDCDSSLLASKSRTPRALPLEGYFGYSVQLLESLYESDDKGQSALSAQPGRTES